MNKIGLIFGSIVLGILLILGFMFGMPVYNVWQQEKAGEARLAEASQSRQVVVQQAKAEKEAAEYQAQAIKIMGKAAKEFPEYRQQEFIGAFGEAVKSGSIDQIIYVPTEGNIPITEANRMVLKQ